MGSLLRQLVLTGTVVVILAISARAATPVLSLTMNGPIATIRGSGLTAVAGLDITVGYDTATIAAPRVTLQTLFAGSLMAANTSSPGIIRMGIISALPDGISGSGDIVSITFEPVGAASGHITAFAATASSPTSSVPLQITPVLHWPDPAPVPAGTPLSVVQLNATSTAPGTFVYTPPAGTVLAAGTWPLSVSFTPADPYSVTASRAVARLAVNPVHPLSVTLTGSGAVNSTPAGIQCRSTGTSGCSAPFVGVVTLAPAPADGFLFGGWGGDCSGTGGCTVTMTRSAAVTAAFFPVPPVLMAGVYYDSLLSAYAGAPDNAAILLRSGELGPLSAEREVSVTISGGFDPGYRVASGVTVLRGPLTVRRGSVAVDGLAVR